MKSFNLDFKEGGLTAGEDVRIGSIRENFVLKLGKKIIFAWKRNTAKWSKISQIQELGVVKFKSGFMIMPVTPWALGSPRI